MRPYVGVTDIDLYRFLRQLANVDEVNFWQPGGNRREVLAQEIVVPRLASLGTTPSQDPRPARGPPRGVDDLEAALAQFGTIAADLKR